jgi:putative transposase
LPELDERLAVLGPHVHHGVPLSVAAKRAGPVLSYAVVRLIVLGLARGLLAPPAHHGPAVYRDNFELVFRRESAHPSDNLAG